MFTVSLMPDLGRPRYECLAFVQLQGDQFHVKINEPNLYLSIDFLDKSKWCDIVQEHPSANAYFTRMALYYFWVYVCTYHCWILFWILFCGNFFQN